MADQPNIEAILKERFAQLPKVVQDAITSATVEKQLRELVKSHNLHLDQWEKFENEVMMTLFGVTPIDELQHNIEKHVGVDEATAASLMQEVSEIVFRPIREALEQGLLSSEGEKGDAPATTPAPEPAQTPTQPRPAPTPATPPAPAPEQKAARAPIPEQYHAGESSSARKNVDDDPYREPIQ